MESFDVKIKCKGSNTLNIHELLEFQGNLKTLSDKNYTKLKNILLKYGFCEPITVYKNYVLNGHQRLYTLKKMIEEGYNINPEIPVSEVKAKNKEEAKKLILSLTSNFGKMDNKSLLEFTVENNISIEEIKEFELVDVNFKEFEYEYNAEFDVNDIDNEFKSDLTDKKKSYSLTLKLKSDDEFQYWYNYFTEKNIEFFVKIT